MCKECEIDVIKENIKTRVCKSCGIEKPVDEFQKAGIKNGEQQFKTVCKICTCLSKFDLDTIRDWSENEIIIVVDNLLNKKSNTMNEITNKLKVKTIEQVLDLVKTLKLTNHLLKFEINCLNCNNKIKVKAYEYLDNSKKFCSFKCSVNYNQKSMWFRSKEEFIDKYRTLGLVATAKYYNKGERTISYWANKFGLSHLDVIKNLTEEEVIKIYKLVLNGELKAGFPNGFSKNIQYVKTVIRYLFNDILKWDRKDICNYFIRDMLREYKLDTIINTKLSPNEIINESFPEYNINIWELKMYDKMIYKHWNDETKVQLAKEWFKRKLKNDKQIIDSEDLQKYNLRELLHEYNLHSLCIANYNYDAEKLFSEIYDKPIKERNVIPYKECNCCHKLKPFTKEYFVFGAKYNLYQLSTICKECTETRRRKNFYKKKGIIYENDETDIDPIRWYKYYANEGLINVLPKYCYTKENMSKIIRYILLEKLNICKKEDLSQLPMFQILYDNKIVALTCFSSKLEILQCCFPEFNFNKEDLILYTDDYCDSVISNWIKLNNITIKQLLENRGLEKMYDRDMKKLLQRKRANGETLTYIILKYLNKHNVINPLTNKPISILDFSNKPRLFWNNKNNRISAIKYFCEKQCEESIVNYLNNHINLKQWIDKYYQTDKLRKDLIYFTNEKWYRLLIEAYPIIKENKLMFKWEWIKNLDTSKNNLIKLFREFVEFRLNDIIIDIKTDIPKYINSSYLNVIYPKIVCYVTNKTFNNFYEWSCLAFPEYKDYWKPEDFGICMAYDGTICNSKQEVMIYEFIKKDLNLSYIKAVGMKRKGKYVFPIEHEQYTKLIPDFVIENMKVKNKKISFIKPIIIEYYGLYNANVNKPMIRKYVEKTKIKNEYYNSRDDICFIDLYPEDLKNNFEGVRKKLTSFFMQNFNFDINKVA